MHTIFEDLLLARLKLDVDIHKPRLMESKKRKYVGSLYVNMKFVLIVTYDTRFVMT